MAQEPAAEPATVSAAPEAVPAPVEALEADNATAHRGDAQVGAGKAAVCAACHGMDGNSADPQYPKLAGQHERYIARQLALYKAMERDNAIMLGFAATLGAQDMRDIGAYFASQKVVPGVADDSVIAEGPYAGQKFYQVGERLFRFGKADGSVPACTDLTTKPWVIEAGVNVIDAPFVAHGNVATAGGCLASQYLAMWMIARGASVEDAADAMHYVAPVGEKDLYIRQALSVVAPFLAAEPARAA